MPTLGEHNPALARSLGLDLETLAQDADYVGKLAIVTWKEPNYQTGGRRDPVADLPPTFDRYGIVDRDHRDRVQVGETWIVRPYTPVGGTAVFLTPVAPVELSAVLALDKDKVQELARELVAHQPNLVEALRDLLPSQAEPRPDPQEVAVLRSALTRAQAALANASRALGQARQETLTLLEHAADDVAQAAAGIDSVPQPAANVELVTRRRDNGPLPVWLADANLFINAERWKWQECNQILDAAESRLRLATTQQVHKELVHHYRVPSDLLILEVEAIDAELEELAEANASAIGKKAGANDLSLVQALLDHEEVRGIITEDPDILNIHPPSLVTKLRGRTVECLSAREFVERHKKLVTQP